MDAAEPQMPDESEVIEDSQSDNLTYIPFEEFQKSLKN
jgi:hypothetical protein